MYNSEAYFEYALMVGLLGCRTCQDGAEALDDGDQMQYDQTKIARVVVKSA